MKEGKPLAKVLVLTGVCCSGKSTLGAEVSKRLEACQFFDGDDLHSPQSIRKMREGTPLVDEDRWEWLGKIADLVVKKVEEENCRAVIACSALKAKYRRVIQSKLSDASRQTGSCLFVYLQASEKLIADRLAKRKGHFMPASLLASQFEALEEPRREEEGIEVLLLDASQSIQANTDLVVQYVLAQEPSKNPRV